MTQIIEIKLHAIINYEKVGNVSSLANFYTFLQSVVSSKIPTTLQDTPLSSDQYFNLKLYFSLDDMVLYNKLVEYINSLFLNGLVDTSQLYMVRACTGDQPWVTIYQGGV